MTFDLKNLKEAAKKDEECFDNSHIWKALEGFEKKAQEICDFIDTQWDSVSELIPCKAPCAREVEEVFRRIKEVLSVDE